MWENWLPLIPFLLWASVFPIAFQIRKVARALDIWVGPGTGSRVLPPAPGRPSGGLEILRRLPPSLQWLYLRNPTAGPMELTVDIVLRRVVDVPPTLERLCWIVFWLVVSGAGIFAIFMYLPFLFGPLPGP